MRQPALLAGLVLCVAAASPARAEPASYPRVEDPFQIARGPLEIRDEFLLAQPRLTLPAVGPDVLPCGRWRARLHLEGGNDFGFSETRVEGSNQVDRQFMVDGERYTVEGQLRRGFGHGLDAGLRVPVRWRGGGWMDGLIEWWHTTFGFQNNQRDYFDRDQFRVEGRDADFDEIRWTEQGWGLGNVELDVRWAFLRPGCRSGWRAAVIGRVGLPTGTGPYETDGVDAGLQLVAARRLGRRFDVYGGIGGTWFPEEAIRGVEYEPLRAHGFLTMEWRATAALSVLVQTDMASRLVTNLQSYPALQWYVMVGGKLDLGGGWRLTAGLTQNLADQQSTSDVSFWTSLEVEF